jgi:hypothetical protein
VSVPEAVSLLFSPEGLALREQAQKAAAADLPMGFTPDQLVLLLGEPLPEVVRSAWGTPPEGCPEPVWRMLVVAADLAAAIAPRPADNRPLDVGDFDRWATKAWGEANP